jgi:hypothetical protein
MAAQPTDERIVSGTAANFVQVQSIKQIEQG